MDTYVYLGNTPYQNETFKSSNISNAFLTQRDIAVNVTIDQWIWPSINVSLLGATEALTMGYTRLVVDLDWNNSTYLLAPQNETLQNFLTQVNDYLIWTDLDTAPSKTNLVFLIFNLQQRGNTTVLSQLVQDTFSSKLYTPANLTADRNDTSEQWPTWLYLIHQGVQVLASYSNTSMTETTLFDTRNISNSINTTCPSNQSWSFVSDTQTPFTYLSALEVTECNRSPFFTHTNYSTLGSFYSAVDSGHLADNVLSTIWSWDVNEPSNVGRCAAIKVQNGRWRTLDCAGQYRVACRATTDPTRWTLTDDAYSYDRSLTACPDNYVFDVPRIPFQNKILKDLIATVKDEHVWINLNLAYTADQCWVVGLYGTCWWSTTTGEAFLGLITTSIVGGVIVLILVGIFIWIKCARLWRNRHSKSRKAMVQAMIKRREYVTVPA